MITTWRARPGDRGRRHAGLGWSAARPTAVLCLMEFFRPTTWPDALAVKAAHPEALPLAGGTDVMVDVNFDRVRPPALLDLTGIRDLAEWSADDGVIRLGAGVSYTRVINELSGRLPGLALASRTV